MGGNFRLATRLIEHQRYVADHARVKAYQQALVEQIHPGDVVLDLGCGTGILGLLALRAGARHVYAVDEGPILQLAQAIAQDNGYADRVTHIRGRSDNIALPQPANVLVTDQMAPFGLGAGLLRYLRDAATRLLTPNARLIPQSLSLCLAPAQAPEAHDRINTFAAGVASLDFSAGLRSMQNMGQNTRFSAAALLAPPQVAITTVLPHPRDSHQHAHLRFCMTRAGVVHGLMGCFRAQLSNTVMMTNNPCHRHAIDRDQLFLPTGLMQLAAGEELSVELHIQHRAQLVSWRLWRTGDDKPPLRSTFAGMFIDTAQ